jgi:hypothetical protein
MNEQQFSDFSSLLVAQPDILEESLGNYTTAEQELGDQDEAGLGIRGGHQ